MRIVNFTLAAVFCFTAAASFCAEPPDFDGRTGKARLIYDGPAQSLRIPAPARAEAEWTILAFMNAKNNLEASGLADLNEMELAGSSDKVNIVAQTTQEAEVFRKTVAVVRRRGQTVVVSDTICKPSRDRQRETVELAGQVDLMIVVGAKHSANTARLAALCRRLCPNTVAVESDVDVDATAVRTARRIGVTAGASTPDSLVERVLCKVSGLHDDH